MKSVFITEFELDLEMFIKQSFLLREKINLNLLFRSNSEFSILRNGIDKFITNLRKWFVTYMKRWLDSSQPIGLSYHIHFIKQLEIDMVDELSFVKEIIEENSGHDYYNNITGIKSIYEDDTRDEFKNIVSVGNSAGLKALWGKYRL